MSGDLWKLLVALIATPIVLLLILKLVFKKGTGEGVREALKNTPQYLALIISFYIYWNASEQIRILEQGINIQKGEVEYRATLNSSGALHIEQLIGPSFLPPSLTLTPHYQQAPNQKSIKGKEVLIVGLEKYYYPTEPHPYLKIPKVEKFMCENQPDIVNCKELALMWITIKYERYDETYYISFDIEK